jgi:hypothetical protein
MKSLYSIIGKYIVPGKNLMYLFLIVILTLVSCKKYLDKKPDESLAIPTTLSDALALLDYYSVFNAQYSSLAAQSDDDYYLLDNYYNNLSIPFKNNYRWAKEAIVSNNDWTNMYKIVSAANVSLETLEKISLKSENTVEYNKVKGSALFYRAYAFHLIAQYFAEPFSKTSAAQQLGIPLRLNSDINVESTRSTLEQTYQQITGDLKQASQLLPVSNPPLSRPSKVAAFAALARIYLIMDEYGLAGQYADSCLSLQNTLMNYSSLTTSGSASPFKRLNNPELIFQAVNQVAAQLSSTNWKCDNLLYQSYSANDIRKTAFFTAASGFKGNYDGATNGANFSGLAVDEIYLIRAECSARLGNKDSAMNDLNSLLRTRWKKNTAGASTYVDQTATDANDALIKIITERRKELVGRGQRWFDLRRLNKDANFAKTLLRTISGQPYSLPPNDPRYTFLIPQQVIDLTGMSQNSR